MSLIIDIHAIQTLPPSNVNRDDTGAPKSAVFGGVPRQRVSSQSWKRAMRRDFEATMPPGTIGYRTKHVVEKIVDRVMELDGDLDRAKVIKDTAETLDKAGVKSAAPKKTRKDDDTGEATPVVGYLYFISPLQIDSVARAIVDSGGPVPPKDAKVLLNHEHSFDIAAFGRMVADDASLNVDAAMQVAHAISVHEVEPEIDYFTAVDDVLEDRNETGAGMVGTIQMSSSTLYRFASIDVLSLAENLGDDTDLALASIRQIVRSFVTSVPSGKQNTFAHNTLPDLVYVTVRSDRSVSLVSAFETPVRTAEGEDRRAEAVSRLAEEERTVETEFGFVPDAALVVGAETLTRAFDGLAEKTTLPEMGERLDSALREAIAS